MAIFTSVTRTINIELEPDKAFTFSPEFKLLGWNYNLQSTPKQASLPADKVTKTLTAVQSALSQPWVSAELCDSLHGLLQHCAQGLVKGKYHLVFTVAALRQVGTRGAASMHVAWATELLWWSTLLTKWNRVSLMIPMQRFQPAHSGDRAPFTDACRSKQAGTGGAGGVFGIHYHHYSFTAEEIEFLDIMDLEALASVLWLEMLCNTCPGEIEGRHFIAWCDNEAVVAAVNSNKSNEPTMALMLHVLHDLQSRLSFNLELQWVDTHTNLLADLLSRNQIDSFFDEMLSLGHSRNSLVLLQVSEPLRQSLASEMICARRWRDVRP